MTLELKHFHTPPIFVVIFLKATCSSPLLLLRSSADVDLVEYVLSQKLRRVSLHATVEGYEFVISY